MGRWELEGARLFAHGVHLAGVFSRAGEALRAVAWEAVDVAAVQARLPDMDSLAFLGRLGRLAPEVRVIVASEFVDQVSALRWLMAGAAGCVGENPSAADLARACLAVAETGLCLPPRAMERVVRALLKLRLASSLAGDLTPREVDVLIGVLLGSSNKGIAGWLGIEVGTVKRHVHRLLRLAGAVHKSDLLDGFSQDLTGAV